MRILAQLSQLFNWAGGDDIAAKHKIASATKRSKETIRRTKVMYRNMFKPTGQNLSDKDWLKLYRAMDMSG